MANTETAQMYPANREAAAAAKLEKSFKRINSEKEGDTTFPANRAVEEENKREKSFKRIVGRNGKTPTDMETVDTTPILPSNRDNDPRFNLDKANKIFEIENVEFTIDDVRDQARKLPSIIGKFKLRFADLTSNFGRAKEGFANERLGFAKDDLKEELSQLGLEMKDIDDDVLDRLSTYLEKAKELVSLDDQRKDLSKEIQQLPQEIDEARKAIDTLRRFNPTQSDTLSEFKNTLETKKNSIPELKSKLVDLESQLEEKTKELVVEYNKSILEKVVVDDSDQSTPKDEIIMPAAREQSEAAKLDASYERIMAENNETPSELKAADDVNNEDITLPALIDQDGDEGRVIYKPSVEVSEENKPLLAAFEQLFKEARGEKAGKQEVNFDKDVLDLINDFRAVRDLKAVVDNLKRIVSEREKRRDEINLQLNGNKAGSQSAQVVPTPASAASSTNQSDIELDIPGDETSSALEVVNAVSSSEVTAEVADTSTLEPSQKAQLERELGDLELNLSINKYNLQRQEAVFLKLIKDTGLEADKVDEFVSKGEEVLLAEDEVKLAMDKIDFMDVGFGENGNLAEKLGIPNTPEAKKVLEDLLEAMEDAKQEIFDKKVEELRAFINITDTQDEEQQATDIVEAAPVIPTKPEAEPLTDAKRKTIRERIAAFWTQLRGGDKKANETDKDKKDSRKKITAAAAILIILGLGGVTYAAYRYIDDLNSRNKNSAPAPRPNGDASNPTIDLVTSFTETNVLTPVIPAVGSAVSPTQTVNTPGNVIRVELPPLPATDSKPDGSGLSQLPSNVGSPSAIAGTRDQSNNVEKKVFSEVKIPQGSSISAELHKLGLFTDVTNWESQRAKAMVEKILEDNIDNTAMINQILQRNLTQPQYNNVKSVVASISKSGLTDTQKYVLSQSMKEWFSDDSAKEMADQMGINTVQPNTVWKVSK